MEENQFAKSNFVITDESESFLKETAKWAYFLSILGFVFIGIIVLMALFVGSIISKFGAMGGNIPIMGNMGGFIILPYLSIIILYFFPIYYLFLFSSKAKKAFKNNDNEQLNESFQYLKSHYKFMGILALIFLIVYGFIFLITFLIGMATIF